MSQKYIDKKHFLPSSVTFRISNALFCIIVLYSAISSQVATAFTIQFRPATQEDVSLARKILLTEGMNPLSVSTNTLLVAYGEDEEMDDKSRNSDANNIIGFGQIRLISNLDCSDIDSPLKTSDSNTIYHELASLYVLPQYRKQGVGSALVSELIRRFDETYNDNDGDDKGGKNYHVCCLLTLRPTIPFYEPFGFKVVQEKERIPPPLNFEFIAGTIISVFLGNDLICMVREGGCTEFKMMN